MFVASLLFCFSSLGFAQDNIKSNEGLDIKPTDVIQWQPSEASLYNENKIVISIRLTTREEFAVYKERLSFENEAGFFIENMTVPLSRMVDDPILGKKVEIFEKGDFTLTLSSPNPLSTTIFPFSITFVGCQGRICLYPYTQRFDLPIIRINESAPQSPKPETPLEASKTQSKSTETDWMVAWAQKIMSGDFQLGLLFLVVFIAGLLTNLTPCVYPMIPITLRLLGGQGKTPFSSSSCYAGGILFTYTALGVVAGLSGSLFGSLLSSTPVNVGFAIVMIFLGISMLGVFDFSFFQRFAPQVARGSASLKNAFIMGIGAGFIASPCTGPILAALIAYTAKEQNALKSTLLLFTYSLGFALPYVFLGGLAGKVSKVKLSFRVQLAVKLIFASIMIALGFYYLRVPAHRFLIEWQIEKYWEYIAIVGVGLGTLCGVLWLWMSMLQDCKIYSVIISVILGIGIFSVSQMEFTSSSAAESLDLAKVKWFKTEQEGFENAKKLGGPILLDGWAEWCAACKEMEATTFRDPAVVKIFLDQKWTLVKLDLTEDNDANNAIQQKYGFFGLPSLIMLPTDGDLKKKKILSGYISEKTMTTSLNEYYREIKN